MKDRTVAVFRDLVEGGHYDRDNRGLSGKYDNVRKYWEDKITQYALRPHLAGVLKEERCRASGLRMLDLGCGSGEGFELLTNIEKYEAGIRSHTIDMLGLESFGHYTGIDLNPDMLEKAGESYRDPEKFTFKVGDLSEGIPTEEREEPYDLYYSSYGSFSHIDDEALKRLLAAVACHARNGSLVVGDWLGRYSYEWPGYWEKAEGRMLDYSMSWLNFDEKRDAPPQKFPLRFWSRDEIEEIINEVEGITKFRFERLSYTDRSIFVGRHLDTGEYNMHARPIRRVVNTLHEDNMRTDLKDLIVDYNSTGGFKEQNDFFEELQDSWNMLVNFTQEQLADPNHWKLPDSAKSLDSRLKDKVETMNRVIKNVEWMKMGDTRANIIEPQLGYALRGLEMDYQRGKGMAHGLIGVFRIIKD